MSYQPDDRHERDVLPPRNTSSNVTLDKEKYDKNSIRSPQPTDGLTMFAEVQNYKKSSQSRPIAPASHPSINPTSHFLPPTFGMYSQMPSVMMQTRGTVPAFLPFARHLPTLAVSATAAGVAPRPSLASPGRPPVVGHHIKPAGLPSQLHTIPGMPLSVHHASTSLQQTRSPSPKLLQETTVSEVPKGDVKSQAIPTEAHSVIESRPVASEPASHTGSLHHTTSTTTSSKTPLVAGLGKNSLGLSAQPIGTPSYIKHTASTSQHLSSGSRVSVPGPSQIGPVSSFTPTFNTPKVISHVGQSPALGPLYSQPSPVSFATRPPQLQDNRLVQPSSTTSSVSFGGHAGTPHSVSFGGHAGTPHTTVVSATAVQAGIPNARPYPVPFQRMPYFDGHTVSSLQSSIKSYVPIESVVRKPTSIAQVPSASHVTSGISSVQLMTSHNPTASVAVVNMSVPFTNSEASAENTAIHSNSSHSNSTSIFSVQNMLSSTSSSGQSIPSSSNVTSLSPRPSILRKRQELSRKPVSQPSLGDPMVLVPASDISGSPRPDGTLSASHSRQNSPKSEAISQSSEQPLKTLENGPSHPSILSPSKIKREFVSPSSTPPIPAPTVNTVSLSAVPPHDAGASPRKKPRKQHVIATEDKFGSAPQQVEGNDKKNVVNDKLDQEEDEELKFLMLKRRCVSIYGGYKVNHKAAHNHFQRYSDVKAKDEKKPSLQEIASERSINQRATGWKIHHVAAQLDELKSCEEEVLVKMYEFRERLPKYKPDHKRYDDLVMLHELLQGNIQRSQLVIEQLGETKKTTVKILDHKQGIMDILKKNIKRHVKKKS